METFKAESLLEPLNLYKEQLKDAFHRNAEEYFEELTKKGKVDVALNQDHCKKYYKEEEIIAGLTKKRNIRRFFRVMLIIFGIGLIVLAVLFFTNIISPEIGAMIGGGI